MWHGCGIQYPPSRRFIIPPSRYAPGTVGRALVPVHPVEPFLALSFGSWGWAPLPRGALGNNRSHSVLRLGFAQHQPPAQDQRLFSCFWPLPVGPEKPTGPKSLGLGGGGAPKGPSETQQHASRAPASEEWGLTGPQKWEGL